MNYRFDARKATHVAGAFIRKEGGTMNIMKFVKLAYLLDRLSLDRRGIPVLGGDYFSMKNGPVIGELLDLINSGNLYGMESDWESFVSDRNNHEVVLVADPGGDRLSDSEVAMINEIYAQHGRKNQFDLRDWCHDNLPEWHRISGGRKEISVECILEVLGKSSAEIQSIVQEEREFTYLNAMLA